MVLESIFPVKKVIKNPIDMFVLSVIITLVSIYIANMIFPGPSTGKLITVFITVALAPVVYGVFKEEEETEREEAEHRINKGFFDRHEKPLKIFTLLFIGIFTAIFIVSVMSDSSYVDEIFSDQLSEIQRITSISSGNAVANALSSDILDLILWNNLRVMGLSFLLSFLIGVGSIVILAWNASILALYLASFVKKGLIEEFMVRTISIIPHAPIEIFGYFFAGIAGGILSAGLIREKFLSKEFLLVFKDSLLLMFLAIGSITVGALVEVFL
ncbi:hypothetical protein A3K64_03650 [Candidatus Micrarchaeota archaeon RBG_16_36_9]|nr:MAG: hypothetical protein A3K64_03650 [Candidatus Micrarchaeota archaeon RBG_16_36_9]